MKISEKKIERISEQILSYLYSINPRAIFTVKIAEEVARDEEFIKKILLKLKKEKLIIEINKNNKGTPYKRRSRWKLSDRTYQAYKLNQP